MSVKPAASKSENLPRSSSEKPALPLLGPGFFKSISLWATLKSPHMMTGFGAAVSPACVRGSTSLGMCPAPSGWRGGVGAESDHPVGVGALDGNVPGKHALFKPLAKVAERIVPFHAMPDAGELVLRVRRVHIDEPELGELERDDAPLGIEVFRTQPVEHLKRRTLGEDRCPRVALPLGITPELQVLGEIERRLPRLELRLLQGEDVSVELGHDVLKALLHNSAQAVHVPRDQSHRFTFPSEKRRAGMPPVVEAGTLPAIAPV